MHSNIAIFSGSRVSGNSGLGFFSGFSGFLDAQVFYIKNLFFNRNVFYNRPNNGLAKRDPKGDPKGDPNGDLKGIQKVFFWKKCKCSMQINRIVTG
jgi:hypothetical protein